jgi:TPR repeat protein
MRSIGMCFLLLLALPVPAQVEITVKKIGPDHVRRMMEIKRFQAAREMALQCIRESDDAWCKFYAAQMISGELGGKADDREAYRLFIASAEQGNPAAQATVGNMYHNGLGVDKDVRMAVSWWEKSAENCNPWAQNAVAHSYYDEILMAKDAEKAYYWIRLAQYFGFPDAEHGVAAIKQNLSAEQATQIDSKVDMFIETSACGDEHKPVINFEP